MSEVKVNKISPRSGTTVTLGDSGDTITLASGVSLTGVNATFSGDLTVDTNTLYVDSANNRVGIGTTSPSFLLELSNSSGDTTLQMTSVDGGTASLQFGDVSDASRGRIRYDNTSEFLRFDVNNLSEAMRIDGNGFVGIGTSSPNNHLVVNGGVATIGSANAGLTTGMLFDQTASTLCRILCYSATNSSLAFYTGSSSSASERMRIDTSGNVLVGKTSSDTGATAGFEWYDAGNALFITRSANPSLEVNRLSSDGDIANFRKDGTVVGSIGSQAGNSITIRSGDVGVRFSTVNDAIYPISSTGNRDNATDLGISNVRFRHLYLGGNIYLGGTGSANALDDYEEGTWTPAVSVGSITTGYTKYTKIGNIVHVRATISSVSDITSLANFELTGLPFTSVGETSGGVMSRYIGTSIGGDAYYWFIPNNATKIAFYASANNSNFESIQHADFTSTSTQFYIMATYRIE